MQVITLRRDDNHTWGSYLFVSIRRVVGVVSAE